MVKLKKLVKSRKSAFTKRSLKKEGYLWETFIGQGDKPLRTVDKILVKVSRT